METKIYYEGRVVMTVVSDDPTMAPRMEASYAATQAWIKDPGPAPVPAIDVLQLDVSFTPPVCGCIDGLIRFDGGEADLPLSQYGDPFEYIKTWLERLAQGEYAYQVIYPEGWIIRLGVVTDPDPAYVVFTVWEEFGAEETRLSCHLRLPRKVLVRAFYQGLMDIWEKPDPESFWWEWDYSSHRDEEDDEDGAYGVYYYHVRSEVIEAYLGT